MFVGIVKLEVYFPASHSLKEKRRHLRKIQGLLLSKFSIKASEVGYQDKWQRAQIGYALVNGDQRVLNSVIDKSLNFVEGLYVGEVLNCEREIVSF